MKKIKKVTVIGWEGYGAKRREDVNTISNAITKALKFFTKEYGIVFKFHEVWSSDKDCIEQVKNIIANTPSDAGVLMVQKSYAGPRSWKFLKKHHTNLRFFPKVIMMFVDPHGRLLRDGSWKPFGKRRAFVIPDKWTHSNMKFFGVYQHTKWPHGGILVAKGAKVQNIPDTNHKKIVNHPETLNMMIDCLNEFIK